MVVDGAHYQVWSPPEEERDFRPIVESHVNEIFGDPSFAFNLKQIIKMPSGKGGIPDDFVLSLKPTPTLWVVENELAKHPVYEHIVPQLSKFMTAMKKSETKVGLIDSIYGAIQDDLVIEATIKKTANPKDIYKFVSELVDRARFVIVIDDENSDLEAACDALPTRPQVVYLKTYVRDPNHPTIQAYVFNSLAKVKPVDAIRSRGTSARNRVQGQHFSQQDYEKEILLILSGPQVPCSARDIVARVKQRMGGRFSAADLEHGKDDRVRWENTVRFAIYQGLKKRGLIEAKAKNQWTLTQKGIAEAMRVQPDKP